MSTDHIAPAPPRVERTSSSSAASETAWSGAHSAVTAIQFIGRTPAIIMRDLASWWASAVEAAEQSLTGTTLVVPAPRLSEPALVRPDGYIAATGTAIRNRASPAEAGR